MEKEGALAVNNVAVELNYDLEPKSERTSRRMHVVLKRWRRKVPLQNGGISNRNCEEISNEYKILQS
jgi:hypothetical protein